MISNTNQLIVIDYYWFYWLLIIIEWYRREMWIYRKILWIHQETVPRIQCGCPQMAQTLYKDRHDRMLRPLYSVLENPTLVNLLTINRGIVKDTLFQVWRVLDLKSCRIFHALHGIWKNALKTVPTNWLIWACLFERDKYAHLKLGVTIFNPGHKICSIGICLIS